MAYTFESRATGELIMLKATAEHLLKLLDKTPGEPGIITVEQIPQALAALDAAVAQDEAQRQALQAQDENTSEADSTEAAAVSAEIGAVSLRQRVVPFADMLRRSALEGKPVTWSL